ncbi:MAG: Rid family detoxifying hydrolase [Bacteroidia bacterium]|nr:Rid family detoxifying hydrolase [Bacteroidia bacterium]MDW8334430.1 Rid family detoxifying hydrolase [Bacteroidia bacterium]
MKRLTHESIKTIGPYSPAAWAGNMLYLSGQIGVDPKTGVFAGATTVEQARQTMTNIGQILQIAGLSYSNIVKTTIFLTDMADFAAVNDVYASFFPPGDYPARETVAVVALPRGAKIEISVVAYKPD